jgi:hypothetical protein
VDFDEEVRRPGRWKGDGVHRCFTGDGEGHSTHFCGKRHISFCNSSLIFGVLRLECRAVYLLLFGSTGCGD